MAKEEGGAFDAEALKQQPVYSLLHGGAGGAAAFAGASPEPGELPRLLLPGDRVVVNLADPAVYSDGELHGAVHRVNSGCLRPPFVVTLLTCGSGTLT